MFVEIKVIEEHYYNSNNNSNNIKEVINGTNDLGSEQIKKLSDKFNLISSNTHHFPCRRFSNVTILVTTYIFSDKKIISL